MKHLLFFILILAMFVNFSCKQEKVFYKKMSLRPDIKDVISTYIKEHPQFNTFILKFTQKLEQNENISVKQGFLLGPGYKSLVQECHSSLHFDISDKRVFFISPYSELIEKEANKWIIENEKDSIIICNDWIIKNSWELFIHRSIYFFYNELGILEVNYSPDTLFAPIYVPTSSIEFQNLSY